MSDPNPGPGPSNDGGGRPFSWSVRQEPSSSIWDTRGQAPIEDPFLRGVPPAMQPPPPPRSSPWLKVLGVVVIAQIVIGGGVAGWWMWSRGEARTESGESGPEVNIPAPVLPAPTAQLDPRPAPTALPTLPAQSDDAVPRRTRVAARGAITIVDLGIDSKKALAEELTEQRAEAQSKGQTLVLMTTRFGQQLFLDVDAAMNDPLLQKALTGVRLVRVDAKFFENELEDLGVPTDSYPWFVLLGADLVPRDGIHGGEWDDDIPRNIAPVLGAFVKGQYTKRRQQWKPPRGKGVQL